MSQIFPWVMHDHDDDDEYFVIVYMYKFDFEFCGVFYDDYFQLPLGPCRQILMARLIRDKDSHLGLLKA